MSLWACSLHGGVLLTRDSLLLQVNTKVRKRGGAECSSSTFDSPGVMWILTDCATPLRLQTLRENFLTNRDYGRLPASAINIRAPSARSHCTCRRVRALEPGAVSQALTCAVGAMRFSSRWDGREGLGSWCRYLF
jgi:hypothetical protein